ncbi:hypothetical protein ACE1CB_19525 [Aerosakkonema sp. BLCC-F2]
MLFGGATGVDADRYRVSFVEIEVFGIEIEPDGIVPAPQRFWQML